MSGEGPQGSQPMVQRLRASNSPFRPVNYLGSVRRQDRDSLSGDHAPPLIAGYNLMVTKTVTVEKN
jgi:hypothetical protein